MAGYVALFNLKRHEDTSRYAPLASFLNDLGPGPAFVSAASPLPKAILFHSEHPLSVLYEGIREHIYDDDEAMLLRVSDGTGGFSDPESQYRFGNFLGAL